MRHFIVFQLLLLTSLLSIASLEGSILAGALLNLLGLIEGIWILKLLRRES